MISLMQKEVGEWSRHNFPGNLPHSPCLGIGEEAGELMHAHLKEEQGIRGTPAEHKAAKEDALGDMFIFMCDYAERNNLDLQYAIERTWFSVRTRDWQRFPKNGRDE